MPQSFNRLEEVCLSLLTVPLHLDRKLSSFSLAIQPNDWAVSLDLNDAYLHVLILSLRKKYLH